MKETLNRLFNHEILTKEEAKSVLVKISQGAYNPSQIASFLTVYMMRSITVAELEGFREALLELCLPIDFSDFETIDLCGTGGDGKDTFNISTTAAFVTAGAGVKVAKHGNYGVSSISGSSNVMESLGIHFTNNADFLKRCIDSAGICILHAPLFHPAMKNVAPIRKELGVKTFFNMLGPMVNPAFPQNQLVGVFSLELARMYGYLYQNTDKNYTILFDLQGYDEVSLTGKAKTISRAAEGIFHPQQLGLSTLKAEEVKGADTIVGAAQIFLSVLSGNGTPAQNQVVCANAGMAIATATGCTLAEGYEKATESLKSKKALKAFEKLHQLSVEQK